MKTIYIVRHAKAEEESASGKDFDRALTGKGIRTAKEMGKRMAKKGIHPGILVTSPAQRALQTAQIIGEKIIYTGEIVRDKTIYNASAAALVHLIKNTPGEIKSLMLVGHNPSLTDLLNYLCPAGSGSYRVENFPKAAAAGILISANDWKKIKRLCGTLLFMDSPKKK